MSESVKCQQCQSEMKKTKKAESNIGLQLIGIILFFVGIVLLFVIPIGTVIGIILIISACGMGYKKKKVWLCKSCGYFFERA